MVVKMKPDADPISARVSIQGIVHWAFLLSSPDHTFKRTGISDNVMTFDLGVPSDLHLDPHEWTFHLANLTNASVKFTIKVDFLQADEEIGNWSKKGAIKSMDEAVPEDRAILVIDPAAGGDE